MTAYLIVRAEVSAADQDAFDHWYETEHLPDAKAAFNVQNAERGWSETEDNAHFAFYEFPDLAHAEAATGSDAITALIAEFDRVWEGRVTRSRNVVAIKQNL